MGRKNRLIYVSDSEPGILRKRHGKGFSYWFEGISRKVKGKRHLKRIESLAIPPALEGVWICKMPNGHLQATGRDSKKRKQYFYHQHWVAMQQEEKFDQLIDFVYALPSIRKQIKKDLKLKVWSKEKVTALAVSLLDEAYMRIGNHYYTSRNNSYGLTTLRRKHTEINGDQVVFTYKGKSGQIRKVKIQDEQLARLVKKCSELPGYELFRYTGDDSKQYVLTSSDVNEYLKEICKEDFTSKSFRLWGGTVTALEVAEEAKQAIESSRKSFKKELVARVAKQLGNTVSVCEKYYIHPIVLQAVVKAEGLPECPLLEEYSELKSELNEYELQALYFMEKGKQNEMPLQNAA